MRDSIFLCVKKRSVKYYNNLKEWLREKEREGEGRNGERKRERKRRNSLSEPTQRHLSKGASVTSAVQDAGDRCHGSKANSA